MSISPPTSDPIEMPLTIREIRLDAVDSGLPRLTLLEPLTDREIASVRLAPDAVRALVDTLAGVAEAAPGEARIIVKVRAEDLAAGLLHIAGRPQ